MSVLPADAHAELAQLLSALQSTDNNVRSQAEEHLSNNWVATKPEMLLMGLVEQIHGSNDTTVSYITIFTKVFFLESCLTNLKHILDPVLCCNFIPSDSLQIAQDR